MKVLYLITFLCLLIGLGCTKFNVEESLPDIVNISPTNMKSKLDRINIVTDSFDYMYAYYAYDLQISPNVEYYNGDGVLLFNKDGQINI